MFSGNYDMPGHGAILGGWRTNWVVSRLQRAGADHQLRGCDRVGNRLLCARGRRSVRRQPQRDAVLQSGRVCDPGSPVATIGQTDFSPLGGKRSQVTGPPLRQLDMGFAKQFKIFGQRQFEIRGGGLQRHEHAVVQSARIVGLPGCEEFREHHEHAQYPEADSVGRKDLLVGTLSGEGAHRLQVVRSAACSPFLSMS